MPLDLSTFEQLGRRAAKKRRPCKIGDTLALLTAKDAKVVDAAIRSSNEDVRRGVRRWLTAEHDVTLSSAAMTAHRAGQCACNG